MAQVNSYQLGKQKAREKAIYWSNVISLEVMDWHSVISWQHYFEKLAKRFGLIREFRENAII